MKNLRIVFMGTPEFAVATLGSLIMNGFNIVGVVTAPDKPSGRGRQMTKSAVKEFAEVSYLPIMQPGNLRDPQFLKDLKNLEADIFLVVAFRMLPEVVREMPSVGTINLHASLLPQYRGAAPVNHVLINGETKTGCTTFYIDDKIDTGNILLQEEIQIFPFENAGDLHDRLMKMGARLVIKTLAAIAENKINPVHQSKLLQPGEVLRTAPKIFLNDCIIDWNKDHQEVHNLIRGLSPYPCARSTFVKASRSVSFKIFESQSENEDHAFSPGEIVSDGKHYIKVACKKGFLNIGSLQIEGKKKMSTIEFLRGFNISGYKIGTI
ncbi:MAG: methionyl-tRNA formyltransferase [Odoribacter sp.]|nr:methionyl-tRNA formyltransferase [Odoribacter sp.]